MLSSTSSQKSWRGQTSPGKPSKRHLCLRAVQSCQKSVFEAGSRKQEKK